MHLADPGGRSSEAIVRDYELPLRQEDALRLILAGASVGSAAGNSVSTGVLFGALAQLGDVALLSHKIAALPTWQANTMPGLAPRITLGTYPICIHGEAILGGILHRGRLRRWTFGWVVNSRYAGALMAAGVPYAVWEPTLLRDELSVTSGREVRASGRGTGVGRALHEALLPFDERLEGKIYRHAVAVYAMSPYTRDRIVAIHGVPRGRIGVLPHPPSQEFLAALGRAEELRSANSLAPPATGRRLLFVGRVDDPRKNFQLLLDALHILRAADGRVCLTVVGPCSTLWREQMERHVRTGALSLLGEVSTDRLASLYLEHDMLVLPSRQEGFGIVVAEALHAGVPVVATRCGGPEYLVAESGAGMLVAHSAEALATAINALIRDEATRRRYGAAGRRYAHEKLSLSVFNTRVKRITMEMARNKRIRDAAHSDIGITRS